MTTTDTGRRVTASELQPCKSSQRASARLSDAEGPHCGACQATEARCARLDSCCSSCSHFAWLDDNGQEIAKPVGRPPADADRASDAPDLDPVVIERLVDGWRGPHSSAERRAAVVQLSADGLTGPQIALRVGVTERQVQRDLEREGRTRRGANALRHQIAERRRAVLRQLIEHGLRVGEMALLLGVRHNVIRTDLLAMGVAIPRRYRPGRSRDVLLATYGHLLDDLEETG